MSRQVIIDRLNIRLPGGWRGDPTLLARRIAEQLQRQAAGLQSTERLDIALSGRYAGQGRNVAGQLSERLQAAKGRGNR